MRIPARIWQYEGLEAVFENFMRQEPGTNAESETFRTRKYNVWFPMFSKISVKGSDQAQLYTGGDIQWNFTKFPVGRDGTIVARFEPNVKPDSPKVTAAIEKALKQAD